MTDRERYFWEAAIVALVIAIAACGCFLAYRNGIVHAMKDSKIYIESVYYSPNDYGLAKIIIDVDGQAMIHSAMIPPERIEDL